MVRLVRWFIFSVVVAMLPILSNMLKCLATEYCRLSITYLFCHGELLIISAAISGSAIGFLVASGGNRPIPKLVAGGSCVIILALCSYLYADMTATLGQKQGYDLHSLSAVSLIMFFLTLIAGASCVILAEVPE